MIESIATGVIANFLTDFIKSCLGLSGRPPPEPATGIPAQQVEHDLGDALVERRAQNRERLDAAKAAIRMVFSFATLLLVATLLPMLLKSLAGEIDLAETRFRLDRSIGAFKLGLIVWVIGLPLFWAVQKVTQWLIQLQHANWSHVGRWQAVRLFTISCFAVLPLYSALVLFFLFPEIGIVQSIVFSLGAVLVAFLVAYLRGGR